MRQLVDNWRLFAAPSYADRGLVSDDRREVEMEGRRSEHGRRQNEAGRSNQQQVVRWLPPPGQPPDAVVPMRRPMFRPVNQIDDAELERVGAPRREPARPRDPVRFPTNCYNPIP